MKKKNVLLIIVSSMFLLFLSVGTLIKPDVRFSPNENRYLEEKPELKVETLLSGEFEDDTEKYLSDQIIGRESWISLKGKIESGLGIKDINETYICQNHRLVQKITDESFNWKQYEKNLKQIELLQEELDGSGVEVITMMVPTASYLYKDQLPKNALLFNEDKALDMAMDVSSDYIDLRIDLEKAYENDPEEDLYYLTDHHWTGAGAFLGYRSFMEKIGLAVPNNFAEMNPVELCDDFKGTLYSKVLLDQKTGDVIEVPECALREDLEVKMDDKRSNSVLLMERLEEKDKYTVFFGGNYGKVEISIPENSKEKLLVVKDSYANSFVPFLINDFSEITMVDTRFFRGNVAELAEDYDKVLILYSINNFAEGKISLTTSLLG